MRIKTWIIGLSILSTVGCSGMSNAEKGMLGGAGVGTAVGALATRGNPAGMVLGGLFGTAVGGMAGESQDRREDRRAIAQAYANAQAQRQMSVQDVIQLSQRNTPDHIIIGQINSTGSAFNLSTNDILDMQNQGVSSAVIASMQSHRPRAVVVGPPPPVVYMDAPPPHVGVVIAR